MAIIFNKGLKHGFKYIPLDQKGDSEPFYVTIKPIQSRDLIRLQDNVILRDSEDKISMRTGSYNLNVCKLAVVGWGNLVDVDGNQVSIKIGVDGRVLDESLDLIPARYFDEIATVALHVSQDPSAIKQYEEPTE